MIAKVVWYCFRIVQIDQWNFSVQKQSSYISISYIKKVAFYINELWPYYSINSDGKIGWGRVRFILHHVPQLTND